MPSKRCKSTKALTQKYRYYVVRVLYALPRMESAHLRKDVQRMRLHNNVKSFVPLNHRQNIQQTKGKNTQNPNPEKIHAAEAEKDPAAILELSLTAKNDDERESILEALEAMRPQENDGAKSSVDDPTRRLTRRLVAARTTVQVQNVLRDAFKAMGDLIKAAASGCEDSDRILRRLQRLIRRATRKVRDLTNEAELRRKEDQARQREMENLARKYELELKQRIAERRRREEGYLRDRDSGDSNAVLPIPGFPSGIPTSAQIKAMAQQAAQAAMAQSASFQSFGGSFGGGSPMSGAGAGSVAVSGDVSSGGGDGSVE